MAQPTHPAGTARRLIPNHVCSLAIAVPFFRRRLVIERRSALHRSGRSPLWLERRCAVAGFHSISIPHKISPPIAYNVVELIKPCEDAAPHIVNVWRRVQYMPLAPVPHKLSSLVLPVKRSE